MTRAAFTSRFADMATPPCPSHSHLRAEHGPDTRYPIAEDILLFPSISPGSHTGLWFVTAACTCADPLRLRGFKTQRRAQWAWRGQIQRNLSKHAQPRHL